MWGAQEASWPLVAADHQPGQPPPTALPVSYGNGGSPPAVLSEGRWWLCIWSLGLGWESSVKVAASEDSYPSFAAWPCLSPRTCRAISSLQPLFGRGGSSMRVFSLSD